MGTFVGITYPSGKTESRYVDDEALARLQRFAAGNGRVQVHTLARAPRSEDQDEKLIPVSRKSELIPNKPITLERVRAGATSDARWRGF